MSTSGPLFQNSVYVGINLEDILYGVELVLYFRTMHVVFTRKGTRQRADVFYAIFSTVMLVMITLFVSTQAIFGEKMWVEDSAYPGGMDAYWAAYNAVWYMDLGTTAITVLQLMTDGLMIYRCRLICESYRVVIVPMILWLATLVLGILVIWTSSSPGGNFFVGFSAELGIAYYTVSVGLTAMLTVMICYRIIKHGRMLRKHLGQEYASVYFALLSVIVESVVPYSLSGIAFLVSFGVGSSTSIAFGCVYLQLMCISPQMVILRVASGLSWEEDTARFPLSTLKLTTGDVSNCTDDGAAGKETVV